MGVGTLTRAAALARGILDHQWVKPLLTTGPRASANYSSTSFGRRDWAALGSGK